MNTETFEDFRELVDRVEDEGLSYFILYQYTPDDMPDEKSKKLFAKAEKALKKFENYIYKKAFSEKNYNKKSNSKKEDKNFGKYACMEDGESQDFYNKW